MVWSCVYLAQLGSHYIQMLVDSGIIHPLLHKLYFDNTHGVQVSAVHTGFSFSDFFFNEQLFLFL